MIDYAKVIERIEALSDVPVPYVILGANWIAYQEEADYAWYEACVDECIEHASLALDRLHSEFDLKQIRGLANYSMGDFGSVQAIQIGNAATAKALNLVKALGLDPDRLFDPFPPDAELLTGVMYAYRARKLIDQSSAASDDQPHYSHPDAGNSAQTQEHNEVSTADVKEQHCQDTEGVATAITEPAVSNEEASHDQATPKRQVNRPLKKPRYEETANIRTRDFTGLVHVVAKQVPQFSAVTPDTGDRLVWYFEVVVHNLQAAIKEAMSRIALPLRAAEKGDLGVITVDQAGQMRNAIEPAKLLADKTALQQAEVEKASTPLQIAPGSQTSALGGPEVDTHPVDTNGNADPPRSKSKSGGKRGRHRRIDKDTFESLKKYRESFLSAKAQGGFDFDEWLKGKAITKKEHNRRMNNTTKSKVERRESADKLVGEKSIATLSIPCQQ